MSIIWITGLAGAGKTTLAAELLSQLQAAQQRGDARVAGALRQIDGDAVRRDLGAQGQGYAREQRLAVAQQIAQRAAAHSRAGGMAVVATISLFHAIHAFNRGNRADYFEVLLACAEPLREARCSDGRLRSGPRVGVEIAAEFPLAPHLRLDSGLHAPAALADAVIQAWHQRHV